MALRHSLLCGLSTSAIALAFTATPAAAQKASPSRAEGRGEATIQDAAAQSSAPQTTEPAKGIADIIVTAQRRVQTLQDTAVPVDAVSGDALLDRGTSDATELTKTVPSLTVTNGGGSTTSLYLRGIGNRTSSSYVDPAVAISYDNVYLGRAAGAFGSAFFDLERVEVLLGPQGILYGRNATGGAINIIPNKPRLGEFGGGFDVSIGNYDAVRSQAYVNVPVGDDIAVRIAGARQVHDGYNRDGTDDRDVSGLRGQILFEPNSDLSVRLAADYTKIEGAGAGVSYIGNYSPNPDGGYDFAPANFDRSEGLYTDAANAYRTSLLAAPGFGFLTPLQDGPSQDYTYWGVNGEVRYQTGIGEFTFIPAYRKSEGTAVSTGPAFNNLVTDETDEQYSFEGRLAGTRGFIDYLMGGYYFHETIDNQGVYNQEFVLPTQSYHQKTESYAAFGQLTANLTDRFRLIGGLRYTHDYKNIDGLISNFITYCGGTPPDNIVPPASFAAGCAAPGALPRYPNFLNPENAFDWLQANGRIDPDTQYTAAPQVLPLTNGVGTIQKTYYPVVAGGNYSKVTWKASAEYDLAPDSLLYATVETGYRAGGFQLAEGKPRYNPEFLTAYTIGSKNRFFDDKLQFNLEAFLWKYRDQQITYFTLSDNGTLISSTENAGKATSKGFDIDIIAQPLRMTTLSGSVQYLDAEYDDLHLYTASPRDNFNCPFTLTGDSAGGAPVKDFNCTGRPLLFAPDWTINLGARQRVPLGDFELVGSIDTAWRDDQYGGFEYLDFEHIPAYWTTDLNLTLKHDPSGFSIGAYILNLEDKRRIAGPQLSPAGQAISTFTAPRTYGIRLTGRF